MSYIVKYFFSLENIGTNTPNLDRLVNQVKGTNYPTYDAKGESGGVSVFSSRHLEDEELEHLNALMLAHDGTPIDFLAKSNSDVMRRRLQDIIATAIDREDLAPSVPFIRQYFNYKNKELDGYIYYGAIDELIASIYSDYTEDNPFYSLLDNPINTDGVKAIDFFIGKITGVL